MNALMLDNYDVVEMDAGVMQETDGGDSPEWLKSLGKKFGISWLASEIISNWDDIEKGFAAGYKSARDK